MRRQARKLVHDLNEVSAVGRLFRQHRIFGCWLVVRYVVVNIRQSVIFEVVVSSAGKPGAVCGSGIAPGRLRPLLSSLESALPFGLLGIDTDNGAEFINATLKSYCEERRITFTRGRPYKKNDQCHVERKNGAVVRPLVGYARYEGVEAAAYLNRLYAAHRLHCPHCGCPYSQASVHGRTGRVHYYVCQGANHKRTNCPVIRINADRLHYSVLSLINRAANHRTYMHRIIAESETWAKPSEQITSSKGPLAKRKQFLNVQSAS